MGATIHDHSRSLIVHEEEPSISQGFTGSVLPFSVCCGQPPRTLHAADCASCHDQGPKVEKSAHTGLPCDTCHEKHDAYPHPAGVPKPVCSTCHENQAVDYAGGVHGAERKKGNEGAPDCAMCHGSAHEVVSPKSPAFRMAVPDTCGMCHDKVAEQYRASVHGQALARGVTEAPLCGDCHGEHKIIRPNNEASPVNKAHVRDTCGTLPRRRPPEPEIRTAQRPGDELRLLLPRPGRQVRVPDRRQLRELPRGAQHPAVHRCQGNHQHRQSGEDLRVCHPGAGTRFAIGRVHLSAGGTEPAALRWVREFYLLLIPATIGLMLLHNGGDWVRKLVRARFSRRLAAAVRPAAGHGHDVRMLPFERVQHAVLVISFFTLVWTGFALKYPDQWWARPLLVLEGAHSIRSLIHRIAAVVFMAVSVTHLISLIVSRKLREHWLEMLPNRNDPREALSNFAYNIGLGDRQPGRSAHSYIEKAEYWAVAWGAIVMIGSGLMLWANNLAMKFLPKLWLDIATSVHLYEAVLATLAIVVWHFYSIIFDPDVYPLNTAFLTGVSVKKEEHSAGQHAKATGD